MAVYVFFLGFPHLRADELESSREEVADGPRVTFYIYTKYDSIGLTVVFAQFLQSSLLCRTGPAHALYTHKIGLYLTLCRVQSTLLRRAGHLMRFTHTKQDSV